MIDRLARGVAAGFAGSLALQALRSASDAWVPQSMPPIRKDPGEFMVEQAEAALPSAVREHVPPLVETAAARSLALGYGLTAGAIYAAVRPRGGDVLVDGVLLGLGTWAAGYLGWLPALGLIPPLPEQEVTETVGPVIRHVLFGVVVVATYRALEQRS